MENKISQSRITGILLYDPLNKLMFHRLLPLLRWVKTIATWKTVIESMQSLGMDNFRVTYTRFIAF